MATSDSVSTWSLTMAAGSEVSQGFQFTAPYNLYDAPYPISPAEWEYVVRVSATDTSPSPLIKVTTTANTQGVLTVQTASSLVYLTLFPAATASLTPGNYWHSLWEYPGTPPDGYPYTWWTGLLIIEGNPQP